MGTEGSHESTLGSHRGFKTQALRILLPQSTRKAGSVLLRLDEFERLQGLRSRLDGNWLDESGRQQKLMRASPDDLDMFS
jgi:hypothetical protein